MVARAVACPKEGLIPIRVINHCSLPLKKGVELAKMEIIEQDCISTVSAAGQRKIQGFHPLTRKPYGHVHVSKAVKHLNTQEKEQLFLLLREYAGVFSFRSSDLRRTSVLQHRINAGTENPIACPSQTGTQRGSTYRLLHDMLENEIVRTIRGTSVGRLPLSWLRKRRISVILCMRITGR